MATARMPNEPPPNYMEQVGGRLVDNGYHVLPIMPGSKKPGQYHRDRWVAYAGWSKHCERETGPFELRIWSRWPSCAVGIACGTVAAVDIDILEDKVAFRIEALAKRMLGDSQALRIGRAPKRLLVYRADQPFEKIKRGAIEILANGQQFVAHADHPDTDRPYQWPLESLVDTPIDRLPSINRDQAIAFADAAYDLLPDDLRGSRLGPDMSDETKEPLGDLRGTYDAVKSALAFIPNDDLHYDDWIRIGLAIRGALGDEGLDLWENWSARSSKSGKSGKSDTPSKVWKGFKPTRIGAGSLYWYAEQNGWTPDSHLILNGHMADVVTLVPDPAVGIIKRQRATMAEAPAPEESKPGLPQGLPLDFVANAPGLLGDIKRWMVETAIYPQPELALAAAITAIGTAAGRRWAGPLDIRTNVYCIGIAESGSGKEHQLGCLSSLLLDAGIEDYFAGEDIASGAAVDSTIALRATQLFLIDEIGHFLSAVLNPRTTSSHKRDVLTKLTKYTGAATRLVKGTEYANKKDRERVDIHQPCICVYGTTVPKPLWESFGESVMKDGSIARWLFFVTSNNYPDIQKPEAAARHVPPALSVGLRRIIAKDVAGDDLGFSTSVQQALNGRTAPHLWRVGRTANAEVLMDEWQQEQVAIKRANERTGFAAIWARWLEHISRLSLIAALARNQTDPEITVEDLMWARAAVDHCVSSAIQAAKDYISDGDYEKLSKQVQIIVRDAGTDGISGRDLLRKARRIEPRLRSIIISDLLNQEIISGEELTSGAKGGRPKVIYRIAI